MTRSRLTRSGSATAVMLADVRCATGAIRLPGGRTSITCNWRGRRLDVPRFLRRFITFATGPCPRCGGRVKLEEPS